MADFLKDYEPVEDRLRAFWSDHPNGRVMTMLIDYHQPGSYIVRAEVFTGDGLDWPAASGLAHDSVDELPPNMKQSALEVCETSAIGRALANMGYAAKGKRPSREEMSKASPAAGPAAASAIGKAAGAATTEPDRAPQAGGTTSDVGEASGSAPGGQPKPPGVTTYYTDPSDCTHKLLSGRWIRWNAEGRCPRCGTTKLLAMES